MEEGTPKVTVIISTYNHEKFIEEAVFSVLKQEAEFKYEVVISDDCSTDLTPTLLTRLQDQYHPRVRLLLAEKNQNNNRVWMDVIQSTPSPYIALLDGDDYWTSPYKLQQQVDFLDSRPECSMCFHNVTTFFEDDSASPYSFNDSQQNKLVTLEDLWEGNMIAGCSPVLRRSAIERVPEWFVDMQWADWTLYILAAERGEVGYMSDIMGAYRVHAGGLWSGLSEIQQIKGVIDFYEQMNIHLNFKYDRIITSLIVRNYYDLARVYEKVGDLRQAEVCRKKAKMAHPR